MDVSMNIVDQNGFDTTNSPTDSIQVISIC